MLQQVSITQQAVPPSSDKRTFVGTAFVQPLTDLLVGLCWPSVGTGRGRH